MQGPRGKRTIITAGCLILATLCFAPRPISGGPGDSPLRADQDEASQTIKIYRGKGKDPLVTVNVRRDARPYLHPIVAPDGGGIMTEYRPPHHLHQTGVFWGFKYVNNRDFFMKWEGENYRRVSAKVVRATGPRVQWQTIYDLLNESGNTVLTETQNWSMQNAGDKYILDLEWRGEARTDIVFGQIYVGGLFIRIPWHPGDHAEAVNANGQRDKDTEQQRAIWLDVGIQVEGRNDLAHIAVLDYPDNPGFPIPWRVDGQYGFGPNTEAVENRLEAGKTRTYRYRLIAYGGTLDPAAMSRAWKDFVKEF
jgi:Methane oxygenase PmoA